MQEIVERCPSFYDVGGHLRFITYMNILVIADFNKCLEYYTNKTFQSL